MKYWWIYDVQDQLHGPFFNTDDAVNERDLMGYNEDQAKVFSTNSPDRDGALAELEGMAKGPRTSIYTPESAPVRFDSQSF